MEEWCIKLNKGAGKLKSIHARKAYLDYFSMGIQGTAIQTAMPLDS